jgi:hypothetical protein
MTMSLNDLIQIVFHGTNDTPKKTAISENYLRRLISEESNDWNIAAVKLASSSESLVVRARDVAPDFGQVSAQEETLQWNELALERLRGKAAP